MTQLQALIAGIFAAVTVVGAAQAAPVATSDNDAIYREDRAPRGGDHERAGDRHRRGGKAFETYDQLAREDRAPRGSDHERAGDRHRRGRG